MALTCPYCRTEVTPENGPFKTCEGCGTPHHIECYEENGGCTLFGCKFAPADDPKLAVTAIDVSQFSAAGTAAAYAPVAPYSPSPFGDVEAPLIVANAAPTFADEPPPPPPPPSFTGVQVASAPEQPHAPAASTLFADEAESAHKRRLTFILLGVFLGSLGVHNFYAGYTKRGVAQLCITLLTLGYASVVTWIWAVVEVCTVDRDSKNVIFA